VLEGIDLHLEAGEIVAVCGGTGAGKSTLLNLLPRFYDPTEGSVRLGGVDLPQGAKLYLWLASAGRDEAAFTEPDRFDLHRPDAERHLAFGKGLHFCLGANFGRLEAQIAVAELARRYPRLRLAPGQTFTFHPNISFRGPQTLKVRPR